MDLESSNINRSFSESDILNPYFRQVNITEFYLSPSRDKPFVRQCSYREINGHFSAANDTSIRTDHSIADTISRYCSEGSLLPALKDVSQRIYNDTKSQNKCWSDISGVVNSHDTRGNVLVSESSKNFNTKSLNLSCTGTKEAPMEIDDECEYEDEQDDSDQTNIHEVPRRYRQDETYNYAVVNRKLRKLANVPTVPKQKCDKSNLSSLFLYIIIPILVVLSCFLYYSYKQDDKLEEAKQMFPIIENILCQDNVQKVIFRNLHQLHQKNTRKVLVFVGTTGVGKTYAANLVRRYFPLERVNRLNFALDNMDNIDFSSSECDYIIIDDLKIEQLEKVVSYISNLPEKCMLIVPIFNIHDVDENMIYTVNDNHFWNIKYEFERKLPKIADVMLFNKIDEKTLTEWLRDQIKEIDISNKDEAIALVLAGHNVESYGFKGLRARINLIGF